MTQIIQDHLQSQTLTHVCRVPFVFKSQSWVLEIRMWAPLMGLEYTHPELQQEPAIKKSQNPVIKGDPGMKEEGNTTSRALSHSFLKNCGKTYIT